MARLLLVDDDAVGLGLRKLICERLGHLVFAATNVAECRQLFATNQPEMVILDLRLPEAGDGLTLIRDLRAIAPQLPRLRIIVLSGWPQDLEGKPEFAMVDEVLTKPVRSAQLASVISSASAG